MITPMKVNTNQASFITKNGHVSPVGSAADPNKS